MNIEWGNGVGRDAPVKVERNGIRADICGHDSAEFVIVDVPRMVAVGRVAGSGARQARRDCRNTRIKVLESHPVVRIWPLQHRLEHHKVLP